MAIERRIRWYQRRFHEHLTRTPAARAIEIAHRRWGKDEICMLATAELAHQRVASYWHCLPEYEQCRKAIWDAVDAHTHKRRIDATFPPEIVARRDEHRMFLELKNGSTWQLIGSDRYDATIGAGVAGIVYSEWATANPSAWAYHRPMLEENKGWAAFISTPRGRNHCHAMFSMAQANPDRWFSEISTINDTHALSPEALAETLREYIALYGEDMGRAQYAQEYECSFAASVLGAFYAREMAAVRAEGRVVPELTAIPGRPVHTAFDIGVRDDTSIWWFQAVGSQLFVLDAYSDSGGGIDRYAALCEQRARERGWTRGYDYVPHDAAKREWALPGAKTIISQMVGYGFNPMPVPDASVQNGIIAARKTLSRCVFHARCEEPGLSALEQYRREWDDDRKAFGDKPFHDWTSHLADAFRYLALSWRGATVETRKRSDAVPPGYFRPPPPRTYDPTRIRLGGR